MNTVFIVTYGQDDDYGILDVFGNRQAAEDFIVEYKKEPNAQYQVQIEEWYTRLSVNDKGIPYYMTTLYSYQDNIDRETKYCGILDNTAPKTHYFTWRDKTIIHAYSYISQEDADGMAFKAKENTFGKTEEG